MFYFILIMQLETRRFISKQDMVLQELQFSRFKVNCLMDGFKR